MSSGGAVWDDGRVAAGLARQLAALAELEAAGAELIGWKVGLGAPAAMAQAGIRGPLVGFLTSRTVIPDGAGVPLTGWTRPAFEPELAVWIGEGVPPGASPAAAARAIRGVGAAIELADVERPLDEVEDIVAGNVFHRRVILGGADPGRAGGDVRGVVARVERNGVEAGSTGEPTALTGDLARLTAHVAGWVAAAGRALERGHVIIAGSVLPAVFVAAGDVVTYDCHPLGRLSVHLT